MVDLIIYVADAAIAGDVPKKQRDVNKKHLVVVYNAKYLKKKLVHTYWH